MIIRVPFGQLFLQEEELIERRDDDRGEVELLLLVELEAELGLAAAVEGVEELDPGDEPIAEVGR